MSLGTPYEVPHLPLLLTISSFIYLLNLAEALLASLINAGLIGSLTVGIIFGPEVSNILPEYIQSAFIILGYIGLILLVFEAGLSTDVSLLYSNMLLSLVVALTGIAVPIAISILLLSYGYGYTVLQAFGAGAALCSTSLGTTLSLLRPELRQTKTGAVLMSAALLDDVLGLVFAAIIPELPFEGSSSSGAVAWQTIARPILVSFGFGFGTPLLAYLTQKLLSMLPISWRTRLYTSRAQLFLIVAILSGFVAAAKYAGTSELFGAYLAGAFMSHIFASPLRTSENNFNSPAPIEAFAIHIIPLLQHFFSPIFFASIGIAIPIRSLFLVRGSRRVIWRGIIYSLLMIVAKAVVGLWVLVWHDTRVGYGWCTSRPPKDRKKDHSTEKESREEGVEVEAEQNSTPTLANVSEESDLPRTRSAALIGLAMVARGEIALIVAQLAQPLLVGGVSEHNSELFAVVIWAVLVTTVGGALGVGLLLRSWRQPAK